MAENEAAVAEVAAPEMSAPEVAPETDPLAELRTVEDRSEDAFAELRDKQVPEVKADAPEVKVDLPDTKADEPPIEEEFDVNAALSELSQKAIERFNAAQAPAETPAPEPAPAPTTAPKGPAFEIPQFVIPDDVAEAAGILDKAPLEKLLGDYVGNTVAQLAQFTLAQQPQFTPEGINALMDIHTTAGRVYERRPEFEDHMPAVWAAIQDIRLRNPNMTSGKVVSQVIADLDSAISTAKAIKQSKKVDIRAKATPPKAASVDARKGAPGDPNEGLTPEERTFKEMQSLTRNQGGFEF